VEILQTSVVPCIDVICVYDDDEGDEDIEGESEVDCGEVREKTGEETSELGTYPRTYSTYAHNA